MGLFGCCESLYKEQVEHEIIKEKPSEPETPEPKKDELLPYKSKFLLTKTEWAFYKRLKESADNLTCIFWQRYALPISCKWILISPEWLLKNISQK